MNIVLFQKATGLGSTMATKWCDPVSAAMALYAIDSNKRIAAFLAQVGHESGGFVFNKELWGPTDSQKRYERDFTQPFSADNERNKLAFSLGNTQKGDGRLFAGRGLIQITGRANYASISKDIGIDYVASPELLEQISGAAQSAAWFWNKRNLNQYADSGDFETLTRRINGGLNGLADRQHRWGIAKVALGV